MRLRPHFIIAGMGIFALAFLANTFSRGNPRLLTAQTSGGGTYCTNVNNIVEPPSERCDDGNTVDNDGCTRCITDAGYVCSPDTDRDFNYTADGTFGVDVPSGIYLVTLFLGDPGPAHDQMGVYLEGQLVDTVSTDAGIVVSKTYETFVVDGQLTLRLKDLGGSDTVAVIEGLVILPKPPNPQGATGYWFDFGTDTSPVAADYWRFTPQSTYVKDGYGWVSGTINAGDRGTGSARCRPMSPVVLFVGGLTPTISPRVGQNIPLTVQVTNRGTTTYANPSLKLSFNGYKNAVKSLDSPPLSCTSSPQSPGASDTTCSLPALPPGSSRTYRFQVTNNGQDCSNCGTETWASTIVSFSDSSYSSNPVDGTSTLSSLNYSYHVQSQLDPGVLSGDVSVIVSAFVSFTPTPNSYFNYVVTVQNNGPDSAYFNDPLSLTLSREGTFYAIASDHTCHTTQTSGLLQCDPPEFLPAGSQITYYIVYNFSPSACPIASFTLTASLPNTRSRDTNLANNQATATTTCISQCNDGNDNDGDGKIDMQDYGCASATDNTENGEPLGSLGQTFSCTLTGWACDADNYATPIFVHFYEGNTFINGVVADQPREQSVANACGGITTHGFTYTLPASLKDGRPHTIYVFAINIGTDAQNPPISGSPLTLTCAAPVSSSSSSFSSIISSSSLSSSRSSSSAPPVSSASSASSAASPLCGNGILEMGEECETGHTMCEPGPRPICNLSTCRCVAQSSSVSSSSAFSSSSSGPVTLPPPLFRFEFDERAGNTVQDISGNGHTAMLSGQYQWVEGRAGGAVDFQNDGAAHFSGHFSSVPFTVTFWIKRTILDHSANWPQIVGSEEYYGWAVNIGEMYASPQGKLHFGKVAVGGVSNASPLTNTDAWHFVAVSYDGTQAKFFVDGRLDATVPYTNVFNDVTQWSIGNYGSAQPAGASLDSVTLYPGVLTQAQIDFLATTIPPTSSSSSSSSVISQRSSSTSSQSMFLMRGIVSTPTASNGTLRYRIDLTKFAQTPEGMSATLFVSPPIGATLQSGISPQECRATGNQTGPTVVCDLTALPIATKTFVFYFDLAQSGLPCPSSVSTTFDASCAPRATASLSPIYSLFANILRLAQTPPSNCLPTSLTLSTDITCAPLPSVPLTLPPPRFRFPFNENAGNLAHDVSGLGNHASLEGQYRWVEGREGSAVEFTGNGAGTFAGNFSAVPFTTTFWIKRTTIDHSINWPQILGSLEYNGWSINLGERSVPAPSQGKLYFGKVGVRSVPASSRITDSAWHFVAVAYDGMLVKFYVDGLLDSTLPFAETFINATHWYIGNYGAIQPVGAVLDEVSLYPGILTPEQVAALSAAVPGSASSSSSSSFSISSVSDSSVSTVSSQTSTTSAQSSVSSVSSSLSSSFSYSSYSTSLYWSSATSYGVLASAPSSSYRLSLCWNGSLETGEECEKGLSCTAGKTCNVQTCKCASSSSRSSSGTLPPLCGNSILNTGEQCEIGVLCQSGYYCSATCQCTVLKIASSAGSSALSSASSSLPQASCGNGLLEVGEGCEAGFPCQYGSCDFQCQCRVVSSASSSLSAATVGICGNGVVEEGEQCDDGNTTPHDGCSLFCTTEEGFACASQPSFCLPVCGDGIRVPPEECDDGNMSDGDGCTSVCKIERGAAPSTPACGNDLLEVGEECDTSFPCLIGDCQDCRCVALSSGSSSEEQSSSDSVSSVSSATPESSAASSERLLMPVAVEEPASVPSLSSSALGWQITISISALCAIALLFFFLWKKRRQERGAV